MKQKKRWSRREFLKVVGSSGALTLGGLSTFRYATAAQKPSQLNLMFGGGSWLKMFRKVFSDPFTKEYGVGINFDSTPFAQRIPKLQAHRKNPVHDLAHLSPAMAAEAGVFGLVEKLADVSAEELPNKKDIHPAFQTDWLIGKVSVNAGMTRNKKHIKREVDSWFDQWSEEYKNKTGIPKFTWMGGIWFHTINKLVGGDEKNIDPGIKKVRELVELTRPVVIAGADQGMQLFTREEIIIAPFWDGRSRQLIKNGVPVDFSFAKEGGIASFYNLGLVKNIDPARREWALKFIDFTLDPGRQVEFSKISDYSPTNVKAIGMLPEEYKALKISEKDLASLAKVKLDYVEMKKNKDRDLEAWKREILSAL